MPQRQPQSQREKFELRLGAQLTQEGLVNYEDLEEAIRQQVIMGGDLATNLWELGLVDGRTLSRLSAKILQLPEVDPTELENLPKATLDLLPYEFAEKSHLLPLGLKGRTLRVATCEPWNHLALGEAAFLSTYPVEPNFIAEVPLMRALAQVYQMPLPARFTQPLVEARAADPRPWDEELPELPAGIARIVSVAGVPVEPPVIQPMQPLPEEETALEPISSLSAAEAALREADDRDGVGYVLLRFALSHGSRVVVLTHRDAHWTGWLGAGDKVDGAAIRRLSLAAEPGSAFGLVSSTGAHFIGSLSAQPVHQEFLQALGPAVPGSIALLPIHFRGRLVLGVYLDSGDGQEVATDVAELLLLAHRVPQALERLIRKRLAEQG